MDEILEEYLKALLGLMEKHHLAEVRLEGPDLKIKLSKELAAAETPRSQVRPPLRHNPRGGSSVVEPGRISPSRDHLYEMLSPLVGVFYRAPSPEAAPLVEPGDYLKPGQVVCLIEAMKMFNEIHAERSGRLMEVCVNEGEVVEAGQVLMILDPHAEKREEE